MRWRLPLFRRTQAEDAVREIVTSEALHNRAALNAETLKLYSEIFSDLGDAGLMGERFSELVGAFARERGEPIPSDSAAILAFMNDELRDSDTPEAAEVREHAELEKLKRNLMGLSPEPDIGRIRRRQAKGLLLTPAEEHLLRVYECECEELVKRKQFVSRSKK